MRSTLLLAAALSCLTAMTGCVMETAENETESEESGTAADSAAHLDWFPGHYVLLSEEALTHDAGERDERDRLLADDIVTPFRGLQIKYGWATFETSEGDYSAGLAALKDDLDALAAVPESRGGPKKLVIVLQYKEFSPGAHAVPGYLLKAGSKYCAGKVCGEYEMHDGTTAMIWQPEVRARLHAWARAVGSYVAKHYPHKVAAVVLPETANGPGNVPLASVGYAPDVYLSALSDNLDALTAPGAFPETPVIQYINFFPLGGDETTYLTKLARVAASHPHAGIGCPDVGSVSSYHPPGYPVLESATFQGAIPFNVAIEQQDFDSYRNTSLAGAYARAIHGSAKGGFGAQMVAWVNIQNRGGHAFDLQDVSDYIRSHPMPNTAPPSSP